MEFQPSITPLTDVAAASSDEDDGPDILDVAIAAGIALRRKPLLWKRVKHLFSPSQLAGCLTGDYDAAEKFAQLLYTQNLDELTCMVESLLPTQPATPSRNNITSSDVAVSLGFLRNAWERKYSGPAMHTFCRYLTQIDTMFDENKHYSRTLAIVQSSGLGKSRLIHEFSNKHIGVTYTLRSREETGYPPGDNEVTAFLHGARGRDLHHGGIIALMGATISQCEFTFTVP